MTNYTTNISRNLIGWVTLILLIILNKFNIQEHYKSVWLMTEQRKIYYGVVNVFRLNSGRELNVFCGKKVQRKETLRMYLQSWASYWLLEHTFTVDCLFEYSVSFEPKMVRYIYIFKMLKNKFKKHWKSTIYWNVHALQSSLLQKYLK